jgi:hypothetical protein
MDFFLNTFLKYHVNCHSIIVDICCIAVQLQPTVSKAQKGKALATLMFNVAKAD